MLLFSAFSNARRTFIAQMLCLLALCLLPFSGLEAQSAQQNGKEETEYKTRKAVATLNLRLYEKLHQATELHQQGDSVAALAKLDKLKSKAEGYNGHEKARLWSAYAYIYYQQDNLPATVRAYKKALAQQGMPEALHTELLYSLAQVYFVLEQYRESLALAKKWLTRIESPGAQANVFVGQLYYQLRDLKRALPFIEKAVASYRAQSKKIPENWYLLLNAMYYEVKAYQKSFRVMLALVADYPKKQYYLQLSALYGQLNQEFKQFSTQQAMNDASLLDKSSELVGFAQFMLLNQRPYQAAKILEQAFQQKQIERNEKNLRLLANAWMMAREDERALAPFNEAASLSGKGELYLLLGQTYLNLDRWQKAAEAIGKALKKGQLKRPDRAQLIRGMALFNLKKYDRALAAFNEAKKDKRSIKLAKQWVSYVKDEQRREREFAELLESQSS